MSTHNWFLLPANPHLPPPDWQLLERYLLEQELILPAVGRNVPYKALHDLSLAFAQHINGAVWQHDRRWQTVSDVVSAHVSAGDLPQGVSVSAELSVEESVDALRRQGIELADTWRFWEYEHCSWCSPRYKFGPAMRTFFEQDSHKPECDGSMVLFSIAADNKPYAVVGENTVAPTIPGSEVPLELLEPFGGWSDFMRAAYDNIQTVWVDPEDGRGYFVMDLDWDQGFGLGWHFIKFEDGGDFDRDRFARVISDIVGQPMMFTYRHL